MAKQKKILAQNKAIFGLGAKRGMTHEDLRDLAFDVTHGRTDSISKLYFDEANGMIERLGGRSFSITRRTENYHKQKHGIKTVVTPQHLQKMNDLWFAKPERTQAGLESICLRVIKVSKPRTSIECNKIIEAIKAMNTRDRIFVAPFKKDTKEVA